MKKHILAVSFILAFFLIPYVVYAGLEYVDLNALPISDMDSSVPDLAKKWMSGFVQSLLYGLILFILGGIYYFQILPAAERTLKGDEE